MIQHWLAVYTLITCLTVLGIGPAFASVRCEAVFGESKPAHKAEFHFIPKGEKVFSPESRPAVLKTLNELKNLATDPSRSYAEIQDARHYQKLAEKLLNEGTFEQEKVFELIGGQQMILSYPHYRNHIDDPQVQNDLNSILYYGGQADKRTPNDIREVSQNYLKYRELTLKALTNRYEALMSNTLVYENRIVFTFEILKDEDFMDASTRGFVYVGMTTKNGVDYDFFTNRPAISLMLHDMEHAIVNKRPVRPAVEKMLVIDRNFRLLRQEIQADPQLTVAEKRIVRTILFEVLHETVNRHPEDLMTEEGRKKIWNTQGMEKEINKFLNATWRNPKMKEWLTTTSPDQQTATFRRMIHLLIDRAARFDSGGD